MPDLLMIEDKYQDRPPRPFAPGPEEAGIVDAVGVSVTGFAPGQRVMAVTGFGGLADYACAPATKTSINPDDMPFDHASALLVTDATAWRGLKARADLRPDRGGLCRTRVPRHRLGRAQPGDRVRHRHRGLADEPALAERGRCAGRLLGRQPDPGPREPPHGRGRTLRTVCPGPHPPPDPVELPPEGQPHRAGAFRIADGLG
ncbi:MAG: hypothetical protein CML68_12975 [Rhodobacteraceae bacterium]|nr:hypothetical protein [Paracoccaceae bacterium]